MLINCKNCNSKNNVFEIVELKDNVQCENRLIFKAFCRKCNQDIAMYLEIRREDKKAFFKNKNKRELAEFLKKEKRNIISYEKYNNCIGWRYGVNKEIKTKTSKVSKIRQYSADFKTGQRKLEKEISVV